MRKSARIRVFDLVKKLGVPKEDVLRVLRELSVGVRSTLSTVDESVAQTVELRLKHQARHPARGRKEPGQAEVPPKLRPRLVRRDAATGRALELIEEARERQRPAPPQPVEAAGEAGAKPAPAEALPAPAKVKPPAPEAARPKPAPPPPAIRAPRIPPAPPRPAEIATLRTRAIPVSQPRGPLRIRPVPSHPAQRTPSHRRRPVRPVPPPVPVAPGDARGEVILTEGVTVKELAEKTGRGSRDLIQILLGKGLLAAINQTLDRDLAVKICEELGFRARVITFEEEAIRLAERPDEAGRLVPRDPVVTVMGHVDHGKTSLLDAIRNTNVVAREHGGITQHIGAYHVTRKGRGITFLDTPGHQAFTRMRARGAQVTDIVVLVVAADDGVMPQTLEAIDHARAAGVPVVTALNKMDKPEANPDKVKKALADAGVLIEEYGGESVLVPVSAKQGRGIEEILEMILLVADMRELRANPDRAGTGTVIEAKLDRTRGAVATVLVQNGTVRVGDAFIAGAVHGKVRAMFDENRDSLRSTGPSRPVEILGLQGVPQAGDIFQVLEDEARARQIGTLRQLRQREEGLRRGTRLTLESLHDRIREGEVKELPLILKGDVQGSVEVLSGRLAELSDDRVQVKVLHAATGPINESDVLLASASNAIVIGFNVRTEPTAEPIAAAESVDIRLHNVIYEVEDQIRNAMAGLLEPEQKEVYQGRAEVREVFRIRRVGTIAGCYIQDGLVRRNSEVRVLRGEQILFQGKAQSLRRFKEDVAEVKAGFECGISIQNFDGFQVGDRIEAFRTEVSAPAARPTA